MASNNNHDNGSSRSPDSVICKELKPIKITMKDVESSSETYGIDQSSWETAKGYQICILNKGEQSHALYQDIMSFIALGNHKKTEIIQKQVDEYIKKSSQIDKLIKESSKLLNGLRSKLEEANNASCAMANCIKNKVLPKQGNTTSDDKIVAVQDGMKNIVDKTKKLDEKGQNAFESAVIIAGIQTFTNTGSLKGFVNSLADAMKAFKDSIQGNIELTEKDVDAAREELNKIVKELAQVMCDKNSNLARTKGLESVIEFICHGECEDDCLDLCKEIKDCLEKGDEKDPDKKRRRYRGKKRSADQY